MVRILTWDKNRYNQSVQKYNRNGAQTRPRNERQRFEKNANNSETGILLLMGTENCNFQTPDQSSQKVTQAKSLASPTTSTKAPQFWIQKSSKRVRKPPNSHKQTKRSGSSNNWPAKVIIHRDDLQGHPNKTMKSHCANTSPIQYLQSKHHERSNKWSKTKAGSPKRNLSPQVYLNRLDRHV